MSFDALERSNYSSIPINLYEFSLGSNVWRYCSSESDVVLGSATYSAAPISDGGITLSGDTQTDDLTVTAPATLAFASLFIATPPSVPMVLTKRQLNRGDTEAPIVWVGQVKSTKRVNQIELQIVCRLLTASLNRNGLRLAFTRGCPHALYDQGCRVNAVEFGIAMQIQSVTGATLISSAFSSLPAGYLAGGYFEWEILPGVLERRAIEAQSGSVVSVLGTTDGISPSQYATFYPGCDRVISTCSSKFNNVANYGGFPHLPSKSPFDGDPIF